MSIRTQNLASAISPTRTTFKNGASPPPDAYASSVSSHSVRSQGVPASPTSAVSALKGLFSGGRPRAASRATSISSDRTMDHDDESFAKRGSNLLSMLRVGTSDTQSVHTVQSARTLAAPTAPLPFAGPAELGRRIERRTIQDPARPLGAWVSAVAEQGSSAAGKERDRASKGLSLSAMSLQPPPRKRWAASGGSDTGATTPTGRPESARRVSFSAEREHSGGGGGGEADSLVGFQFGTPEQRPRPPSLQSVSTLASGEPPLSSSSTTRSSRASARRWSRQGLLPTRTMPPSDPPPAVPHPYAAPESTGGSPGSGGKSVVSGLTTFSKRASAGSVNSFNTMYSHTPSVGSSPRAAPVPHRISMPPPRPAPTSALPPAPVATPAEPPAEPPEEAPATAKASLRTAVAHRTFRLSMGAPKPPPSGTLPPRPDEPTHGPPPVQAHRRISSGSAPPTTLSPIPASPVPPAKTINPFPPPVGPLPPTPAEPPSPPSAPTKRTASLKQRLRNLSNPPPVSTPPPSRARSHTSVAHLAYAPSPPPTPIAEKITLFQNDPSFLQMQTPVPAAAPVPAAIAAFEPMPDDQLDGIVSLLPPPRRGSKQLLESDLERPPRTPEPEPDAPHALGKKLSIVAEPPLLSHLSLSRPGSAMSRRSHHSDTFLEIDWESPKDDTPRGDYPPGKHPSPTEPHHMSLSRPGSVVSLGVVMAL